MTTSTEKLNALETLFKDVLARRSIADSTEARVVQSMRLWAVDCSWQGTEDVHDQYYHDYAVGLAWFNPLTDSEMVLTIPKNLHAEIRDHDGEGEDLTPFWFADALSDPECSDGSIILDAISCFIWECRDVEVEYARRLSLQEGRPTEEEFKKMLDEELAKLMS